MTQLSRLLSIPQVAWLLHRNTEWFYRHRRKLEAERGFPKPVIGNCYDPLAIQAWRLAQIEPHLRAVMMAVHQEKGVDGPAITVATDWDAVLRDNAQRIAGTIKPAA